MKTPNALRLENSCAIIAAMPPENLPPLAPFPDLTPSPQSAADAPAAGEPLLSAAQRREFARAADSLQGFNQPPADDDASSPQEGDFLITPDEKTPETSTAEALPRILLEEEPVAGAGFLDMPASDENKTSLIEDGFNLKSLAAALTSGAIPNLRGDEPDTEPDEWSVAALIAPAEPEPARRRDEFLSVPDKTKVLPIAPIAIETPVPDLITAKADHSTAAAPATASIQFHAAAFPQFPSTPLSGKDFDPDPDFDELLSFPVPSAPAHVHAAPAQPVDTTDPADRGFGMVVSGALLIILGMFLACRIPGLALEADSAAAAARGPSAAHTWYFLQGEMFLSAAGAAALMLLGIGSATLRRWAPPLIHAAGWVVLLTVLVGMGAATASMFYLSGNATAGDAVSNDGTMIFALTGGFGIVLPLGLIALFQRPSIARLCKLTDSRPRWTDRRTVPALMVFVTGVLLAIGCLTLSVAHAYMPLFGERLGPSAWVIAGVISAAAAGFAAAGKHTGWWILLVLSSLLALSLFITCQRHDWRDLVHLSGAPEGSTMSGIIAASAMLPVILILLMTRRSCIHHHDGE